METKEEGLPTYRSIAVDPADFIPLMYLSCTSQPNKKKIETILATSQFTDWANQTHGNPARTMVYHAAQARNMEAMQLLLQHHMNHFPSVTIEEDLLVLALKDKKIMKQLAPFMERGIQSWPAADTVVALAQAIISSDVKKINAFMTDKSIDWCTAKIAGVSLLAYATSSGSLKVVQLLLTHRQENYPNTALDDQALCLAVQLPSPSKATAMVQLLIKHGILSDDPLNIGQFGKMRPLLQLILDNGRFDVLPSLVLPGIEEQDESTRNLFITGQMYQAIMENKPETLKKKLEEYPNHHWYRDLIKQNSLLQHAIDMGQIKSVSYLVSHYQELPGVPPLDSELLWRAANTLRSSRQEISLILLKANIPPDPAARNESKENEGEHSQNERTALRQSIINGDEELCKLLIRHGANFLQLYREYQSQNASGSAVLLGEGDSISPLVGITQKNWFTTLDLACYLLIKASPESRAQYCSSEELMHQINWIFIYLINSLNSFRTHLLLSHMDSVSTSIALIMALLSKLGAFQNRPDLDSEYPILHRAVAGIMPKNCYLGENILLYFAQKKLLFLLLLYGFSPTECDKKGRTPVHTNNGCADLFMEISVEIGQLQEIAESIRTRNIEALKKQLAAFQSRSILYYVDANGDSLLHLAVRGDCPKIFALLSKEMGLFSLSNAQKLVELTLLLPLLENKALKIRNQEGKTPLELAVELKQDSIIRYAIKHNLTTCQADHTKEHPLNPQNGLGETCYRLAQQAPPPAVPPSASKWSLFSRKSVQAEVKEEAPDQTVTETFATKKGVKEAVTAYILFQLQGEEQTTALRDALNPQTPLGAFYAVRRGAKKPTVKAGTLLKLKTKLDEIEVAEAERQSLQP